MYLRPFAYPNLLCQSEDTHGDTTTSAEYFRRFLDT